MVLYMFVFALVLMVTFSAVHADEYTEESTILASYSARVLSNDEATSLVNTLWATSLSKWQAASPIQKLTTGFEALMTSLTEYRSTLEQAYLLWSTGRTHGWAKSGTVEDYNAIIRVRGVVVASVGLLKSAVQEEVPPTVQLINRVLAEDSSGATKKHDDMLFAALVRAVLEDKAYEGPRNMESVFAALTSVVRVVPGRVWQNGDDFDEDSQRTSSSQTSSASSSSVEEAGGPIGVSSTHVVGSAVPNLGVRPKDDETPVGDTGAAPVVDPAEGVGGRGPSSGAAASGAGAAPVVVAVQPLELEDSVKWSNEDSSDKASGASSSRRTSSASTTSAGGGSVVVHEGLGSDEKKEGDAPFSGTDAADVIEPTQESRVNSTPSSGSSIVRPGEGDAGGSQQQGPNTSLSSGGGGSSVGEVSTSLVEQAVPSPEKDKKDDEQPPADDTGIVPVIEPTQENRASSTTPAEGNTTIAPLEDKDAEGSRPSTSGRASTLPPANVVEGSVGKDSTVGGVGDGKPPASGAGVNKAPESQDVPGSSATTSGDMTQSVDITPPPAPQASTPKPPNKVMSYLSYPFKLCYWGWKWFGSFFPTKAF